MAERDGLDDISFAQVVLISGVSQIGKDWADSMFCQWLREQVEGMPLEAFEGTKEELLFLREHVSGRWLRCSLFSPPTISRSGVVSRFGNV